MEGIKIPEYPPTIPPLPDNFDFAYAISRIYREIVDIYILNIF